MLIKLSGKNSGNSQRVSKVNYCCKYSHVIAKSQKQDLPSFFLNSKNPISH